MEGRRGLLVKQKVESRKSKWGGGGRGLLVKSKVESRKSKWGGGGEDFGL